MRVIFNYPVLSEAIVLPEALICGHLNGGLHA